MHSSDAEFIKHGHGKFGPWFDLVNSEEWDTYGHRADHFENPAWLPFFLRRWNFRKPGRLPFPAAQWRKLRTAIRHVSEAAARQKPISSADIQALNQALKVSGYRRLWQRQNGLQLEFVSEVSGWRWILAVTVCSFADILSRGHPARIKICRNPGCRWIFYDQTKAKTRCWCDDRICGNRERVRQARARASS